MTLPAERPDSPDCSRNDSPRTEPCLVLFQCLRHASRPANCLGRVFTTWPLRPVDYLPGPSSSLEPEWVCRLAGALPPESNCVPWYEDVKPLSKLLLCSLRCPLPYLFSPLYVCKPVFPTVAAGFFGRGCVCLSKAHGQLLPFIQPLWFLVLFSPFVLAVVPRQTPVPCSSLRPGAYPVVTPSPRWPFKILYLFHQASFGDRSGVHQELWAASLNPPVVVALSLFRLAACSY